MRDEAALRFRFGHLEGPRKKRSALAGARRGIGRAGVVPIAIAASLAATACFPASYLAQAARGQLGILSAARPIPEVLHDDDVPDRTRRLLGLVRSVKAFGDEHGLRPARSYSRYSDLRRPAAVWVVQACAPLAFQVRRWTFPPVGSIPYLGFFDERAARGYAEGLRKEEALDVEVRTASAFSTLGWFRDPVLSTMLGRGDEALGYLADTILHESVHATLYVKGQSPFNESLASFVAGRLAPRWLDRALGPEAPETLAWAGARERDRAFTARLHRAYLELDALYRSPESGQAKLAGKERILSSLRDELRLPRPLNNATLAGYRTYDAGTPALERLLAACRGSVPRLLRAAATLRAEDFARPQQEELDPVLDGLAARACPPASPPSAHGR